MNAAVSDSTQDGTELQRRKVPLVSAYLDTSPPVQAVESAPKKPKRLSIFALQLARPHNAQRILEAVAARSGFTVETLLGKKRQMRIAGARHLAAWLMRRDGMSYPEIAEAMGCDHTSIMYAVSRIEAEREADAGVREITDGMKGGWA